MLVLFLIGAIFSERLWLRLLCLLFVAAYVGTMIVLAALERIRPHELLPTGVILLGGFLLYELKRSFDRSRY